VSADEYVYTDRGVKQAGDLISGDLLYGNNKVISNSIVDDDLYEVTFSSGIKIKCNGEHPLYWRKWKHTKNGEEFVSVKEIAKGNGYRGKLGYAYFQASGDSGVSLKAPKLFGYLCSDGYVTNANQSVKFTNNNELFLNEVEELVKDSYGLESKRYIKNKGYDLLFPNKRGQANPIAEDIKRLNITSDSFGEILSGNRESLAEFIKGYFNGDGYLLLRKRKIGWSRIPSVEVGFCIGRSKNRAVEFQYILWKLGIYSWIYSEFMKPFKNRFYRVKVNAKDAVKILRLLDKTKYPDKFKEAKKAIKDNCYDHENYQEWISIRSIKKTGRGQIASLTTESGEFISYCGLRNHNTGNQFGKNECAVMDYIFSILGWHPNKMKNIRPDDNRIFRFASHTLPSESEENEVRNTQYPAFKRRFPTDLIGKDITARNSVITVKAHDGGNVNVELVSFGQATGTQAGVQRRRIWIDEECSKDFYEEQVPRLLATGGDILITFTPVPGAIGWMFDEMYERAKYIYRTEAVRKRIEERTGIIYPECEITESLDDICVIMAATDDNPMYEGLAKKLSEQTGVPITAKEYIDESFEKYDDEDVIDARRYGLFRQLSGKIHKSFTPKTHVISSQEYFSEGVPFGWQHFRGIDYHGSNPWACVWMSVSPEDEIFVWCDHPGIISRKTSYDIGLEIAERSGDYKYRLDMIDPLANAKQSNTNLSTIEDLNRYFRSFKQDQIGTGAYWQPWDTKGNRGREELTKRLKNSLKVGKPFNNRVIVGDRSYDRTQLLPTIWFTDNCKNTIESLKNWRKEEWGTRDMLNRNDPKEADQQKWSHFPITVECLLKNPIISSARWGSLDQSPLRPKQYFSQGRR
jgi:phage terminase large subunit-like protein